jgi:hypothetical protein
MASVGEWRTRLRWRLVGAWQWPAFTVLTAVDAVVLSRLPFSGDRADLLGCLFGAGFLNLVVVVVVGRAGGWALRRRRPSLPREIANDAAGALGLVALCGVLIAGGIAHRPALQSNDSRLALAVHEARAFAAKRAPARFRPLARWNTWAMGPDVFRTCFPGPDPRKNWCVVVQTGEAVPIMRIDPDQRPNATVAGPDNPGRRRG